MENYSKELNAIASGLLIQQAAADGGEAKPNYTNNDFFNCILIFQTGLIDKAFDYFKKNKNTIEEMEVLTTSCGLELKQFIYKYTGLDTHNIDEMLKNTK
jgi:hypothetical protein